MKLRVRTLLIAVAFAACLIAAFKFGERRGALLHQASLYEQQEDAQLRILEQYEAELAREQAPLEQIVPRYDNDTDEDYRKRMKRWEERLNRSGSPRLKLSADLARKQATRLAQLKQQYQRAANRPWLSAASIANRPAPPVPRAGLR